MTAIDNFLKSKLSIFLKKFLFPVFLIIMLSLTHTDRVLAQEDQRIQETFTHDVFQNSLEPKKKEKESQDPETQDEISKRPPKSSMPIYMRPRQTKKLWLPQSYKYFSDIERDILNMLTLVDGNNVLNIQLMLDQRFKNCLVSTALLPNSLEVYIVNYETMRSFSFSVPFRSALVSSFSLYEHGTTDTSYWVVFDQESPSEYGRDPSLSTYTLKVFFTADGVVSSFKVQSQKSVNGSKEAFQKDIQFECVGID